jgi:hypothetical protein
MRQAVSHVPFGLDLGRSDDVTFRDLFFAFRLADADFSPVS